MPPEMTSRSRWKLRGEQSRDVMKGSHLWVCQKPSLELLSILLPNATAMDRITPGAPKNPKYALSICFKGAKRVLLILLETWGKA